MSHTQTHSSRNKSSHRLDAHTLGDSISGVQDAVVHSVQGFGEAVKSTIKEKPLQSVGVALGAGLLLGMLIRKSH
jgi:ElaB/YqjD/DUF883 family membrane-anchored ribosome-binding protein